MKRSLMRMPPDGIVRPVRFRQMRMTLLDRWMGLGQQARKRHRRESR